MTPSGTRWLSTVLAATAVVGFAVSMVGCARLGPLTPVQISDIKSVTGTWKGILYRSSSAWESVELTIREDGAYDVIWSLQPIGESRGQGKIVVSDGRLLFEGQRGRGVGTLLTNPVGDRVMNIEATLSDNSTLSAKLSPSP